MGKIKKIFRRTKSQKNAMLQHGLTRDEVKGLSKHQLQAYLNLRDKGLTTEMLRMHPELKSKMDVVALGYLVTVKHNSFDEAFNLMPTLYENQELAVAVSTVLSFFDALELGTKHFFALADAARQYYAAHIISDPALNPEQLLIARALVLWGVTGDEVGKYPWLKSQNHYLACVYLTVTRFMPFDTVIKTIEGLNDAELKGITLGLPREEVLSLNKYQMEALAQYKTIKNGLCADTFRDKPWFNSREHVSAFWRLHCFSKLSVQSAMDELDGLDAKQANRIYFFEPRDNLVNLNEWMLAVIRENSGRGVTGKSLRDKEWFNSDAHVAALSALIKKHVCFNDKLLEPLEKMDQNQLKQVAAGVDIELILPKPVAVQAPVAGKSLIPVEVKAAKKKPNHNVGEYMLNGMYRFFGYKTTDEIESDYQQGRPISIYRDKPNLRK